MKRTKGSGRESSFELLRILSMVCIVACHFSSHGVWPQYGTSLAADMSLALLKGCGEIGVNCFVLTTGYFMVRSRFKSRSLLKVVLEALFYSYAILAVVAVTHFYPDAKKYLVRTLLPISKGNYWFVSAYAGLYILSPALLYLENTLGEQAFRRLLVVQLVVFSVVPTLTTAKFVTSTLAWFVFVFMLGGYLRLYGDRIQLAWVKKVALLCGLFTVISELAILLVGRRAPVALAHANYFTDFNMLPEIGLSAALFVLVSKMRIGDIPAVNQLALTPFATYLITDNPYVRNALWPLFSSAYGSGWMIIPIAIATAIVLYLICAIIDTIRAQTIERVMLAAFDGSGLLARIDDYMNSIQAGS